MSLYHPLVNTSHQQHVIRNCGVCLWLMLQNRRKNKEWDETEDEGGGGERMKEMGESDWSEHWHLNLAKSKKIKVSTWRKRLKRGEDGERGKLWRDWSYCMKTLHKIPISYLNSGPFRINLSLYVPPCPLWLILLSFSLTLSLSSPSREAGSPDPVWKSATHIPPQSTLLWESQALLHERQREREEGKDRESLEENER